ncbi:hypothetical protein AT267_27010 [Bacillus cereus]|nr:hypothetical protein AT267_27010 [Bacillus cereus]
MQKRYHLSFFHSYYALKLVCYTNENKPNKKEANEIASFLFGSRKMIQGLKVKIWTWIFFYFWSQIPFLSGKFLLT